MRQKQDHEVDSWLAHYEVADPDDSSRKALLDKIVAAASLLPQDRPQPFLSRLKAEEWVQDAAALAAVAVLGFWIGSGSFGMAASKPISVPSEVSSISSTYLNRIIFGPKSWKEVSL
jgi:hypothetical protein